MEVAGTVFRQAPCFSSSQSRSLFPKQQRWNRKSVVEFSDKGHLQYYNTSRNGNGNGMMMAVIKEEKEMMTSDKKKKEMMKKKLKLLKGLSKNLSVFEDMGGFGLDEQVRGKMISEATEVLIGELQKLKAEKMELKRMKKEEKAKKKAAKMTMMMDCKSKGEESSSSSSSSESECEKMASCSNAIISHGETTTTTSLMVVDDKQVIEKMNINSSLKLDNDSKIEVCMGGKCKKSGAGMLLESFQKAVGVNGEAVEVVGCKCMGKCRDGPNVKVVVNNNGATFPGLCMGVRLEDVDSIVNDYLFGVATPPTAPAL